MGDFASQLEDLLFTHYVSDGTFCVLPISARGISWLNDNVNRSRCMDHASPLNDVWTKEKRISAPAIEKPGGRTNGGE